MAAIGKVFRKGSPQSNRSVYKTAQYARLTQDPSDDEDDESNVVFMRHSQALHQNGFQNHDNKTQQNGHKSVDQEAIDMGIIQPGRISKGKPDFEVKVMKRRILTRSRLWMVLLVVLIAIILALAIMLTLPQITRKFLPLQHKTVEWHKQFGNYSTESCVRLFDVDEDGVSDIIISLQTSHQYVPDQTVEQICQELGRPYPCIGWLIALRGYDGELLWNTSIRHVAFEISCGVIDVNKDGKTDCLAAGRMSSVEAFDPRTGELLWEGDQSVMSGTWNIFNPLVMMDVTGDSVPELVIAHGGDSKYQAWEHDRQPGRLILLDGATGHSLGRYLEMPDKKETYMSPVLHTLSDGSHYILFGSGGETVAGSFLAIAWTDFYRYVKGLNSTASVPGAEDSYDAWQNRKHLVYNIIEIYSGQDKGVMVPPVCIDLNHDGVKDILMSAYDGTVSAYDGQSLELLWSVSFGVMESYSTPAPGFFNDDDVPDFMIQWNQGAWPDFGQSMAVVLDGKSGNRLWSLNSSLPEFGSSLVVMTTEENRDAFLFRVQGRAPHISEKNVTKRSPDPQYYPAYPQYQLPQRRQQRINQPQYKTRPASYNRNSPERQSWQDYNMRSQGGYPNTGPYDDGSDDRSYGNSWSYSEAMEPVNHRRRYPAIPQGRETKQPSVPSKVAFGESQRYFGGEELQDEGEMDVARSHVRHGPAVVPNTHAVLGDIDEKNKNEGNDDSDVDTDIVDESSVEEEESVDKGEEEFITCDSDLSFLEVEIFLMDRSCLDKPLLVAKDKPTKYTYEIKGAGDKVRRHGGPSHTETVVSDDKACTVLEEKERVTGAVGDVDGDGELDYVYLSWKHGYTKSSTIMDITTVHKINLAKHAASTSKEDYTSVKSVISEELKKSKVSPKLEKIKFLPESQQTWAEYLGYQAKSMYNRNKKGS